MGRQHDILNFPDLGRECVRDLALYPGFRHWLVLPAIVEGHMTLWATWWGTLELWHSETAKLWHCGTVSLINFDDVIMVSCEAKTLQFSMVQHWKKLYLGLKLCKKMRTICTIKWTTNDRLSSSFFHSGGHKTNFNAFFLDVYTGKYLLFFCICVSIY